MPETCARHQDRILAAAGTGPQQAAQRVTKRKWSASSTRTCNRYVRSGNLGIRHLRRTEQADLATVGLLFLNVAFLRRSVLHQPLGEFGLLPHLLQRHGEPDPGVG
jgi:hypothetical protein